MPTTRQIPADLTLLGSRQVLGEYSPACDAAHTAAEHCAIPDHPSQHARGQLRGCPATVDAAEHALNLVSALSPVQAWKVSEPSRIDRRFRWRLALAPVAVAVALALALQGDAVAASPVSLGTADGFALLAGSTITNTGPTTITGDIGLCCTGLATPGFGSVTQPGGAQYKGTGTPAQSAQDDLDIAYGDAAGRPVTRTLGVDLSQAGTPANPLLPGVYESTGHGALQINTGLTLDFQGDPNAVFIFQGTELMTAADAAGSVRIVNGGSAPSACNIFWQLSSDATGVTLGAGSAFKGTTMALGASVLRTGATVQGRILTRRSKAVTLDANTITRTTCSSGDSTTTAPGDSTTSTPVDHTTSSTPSGAHA
ncbi:MAG: DUF3494 domain-containing protein, partial [Actinobacteria bacterium]|nr:DUF3494 domain-containing protein [Actinomycetota bacterium]